MSLRLLQHRASNGTRSVILANGEAAHVLEGVARTTDLARRAIAAGTSLVQEARGCPVGPSIDLAAEFEAGRLLAPIDHEDPAHLALTGTGLTHLGSAEGRDKMHREAAAAAHQTDSMRMFLEGLEGGKPGDGRVGRGERRFTGLRLERHDEVEQRRDPAPVAHMPSSRASQARATVQWRLTVAGETPSAAAVSSIESPPK